MRFLKRISFMALLLIAAFNLLIVSAQSEVDTVFMPIGGGYGDTYDAFIAAALNSKVGDTLKIVVLPSTYASSADEITAEERQENVDAAENRRSQIEEACLAGVPEGVTCDVQLTPIFTRDDAENPDNSAYFTDDVGAVYILGGDQTIAMLVMADTPVEAALKTAYERGALIAGTSAGEAVQSQAMIGGYVGDFAPETGLNEGAVDVWNSDDKRGLNFGITNAILEQHFWERARLGRLLNVLAQPGVPGLGLGIDSYTAATITNGKTLSNVAGLYSIGILDAQTFDAAENADFKADILSMHNVMFHILPPGDFSYDLDTREISLAPLSSASAGNFAMLKTSSGTGTLILEENLFNLKAFNLKQWVSQRPSVIRFVDQVGKNPLLVVVYAPDDSSVGSIYAQALQELPMGGADLVYPLSENPILKSMYNRLDISQYAGIMVVTDGKMLPNAAQLAEVKAAWQSGTPLLLGNAAVDLAQTYFRTQAPVPAELDRTFDDLKAPAGSGTLIVTGSLHAPFENSSIMARFVELAGGSNANILAVYDGFASPDMLHGTAPYFEAGLQALGVSQIASWDVSGGDEPPESFDDYTGILFVGNDASLLHPDQLTPLKDAWLSGKPMLADWTASSVLGVYYAAQGQTPFATDDEPFADIEYIQDAFIDGNTDIQPGLGLLNITIETRLLADYRVGRLVALAYTHPDTLAIGLNEETALEINADGATVLGSNGVFVLDLRQATLAKGTNDAYAFANGLLDTFAPGEQVVAAN